MWAKLSFCTKVNIVRWTSQNRGKVFVRFEIIGVNHRVKKIKVKPPFRFKMKA